MAAVKADTLPLTAWQIGMNGFMAIAQFLIFRRALGVKLAIDSVEFWFMMQLVMLAGRLPDVVSGELMADPRRTEGEDVNLPEFAGPV